jgi:hypothetical protein
MVHYPRGSFLHGFVIGVFGNNFLLVADLRYVHGRHRAVLGGVRARGRGLTCNGLK